MSPELRAWITDGLRDIDADAGPDEDRITPTATAECWRLAELTASFPWPGLTSLNDGGLYLYWRGPDRDREITARISKAGSTYWMRTVFVRERAQVDGFPAAEALPALAWVFSL